MINTGSALGMRLNLGVTCVQGTLTCFQSVLIVHQQSKHVIYMNAIGVTSDTGGLCCLQTVFHNVVQ